MMGYLAQNSANSSLRAERSTFALEYLHDEVTFSGSALESDLPICSVKSVCFELD